MNTRKANNEMDKRSVQDIENRLNKDTNTLTEEDVLFLLARESYLDTDELEAIKNSPAGKALAKDRAVPEEVKTKKK